MRTSRARRSAARVEGNVRATSAATIARRTGLDIRGSLAETGRRSPAVGPTSSGPSARVRCSSSDGTPAAIRCGPESTMRTSDLLALRNPGHTGINALSAKAHSADWDFERDVDWTVPVAPDDPLVEHGWAAYGRTATFQQLPEPAKVHATRRSLGRMLNILQVGESVAQNVCARQIGRASCREMV